LSSFSCAGFPKHPITVGGKRFVFLNPNLPPEVEDYVANVTKLFEFGSCTNTVASKEWLEVRPTATVANDLDVVVECHFVKRWHFVRFVFVF
jgi:hypothetical protein